MSKFTNAIRMLAKQNALDADATEKLLKAHVTEQDGGPGSGNHGHAGRPGKKGGSAPRGGGGGSAGSGGGSSKTPTVGKTKPSSRNPIKPIKPSPGKFVPNDPYIKPNIKPGHIFDPNDPYIKPNIIPGHIEPYTPAFDPRKPSAKEPKYTPTESKVVGSAENSKDLDKAPVGSTVSHTDGTTFTKQKDGTWVAKNPRNPEDSLTYESGELAMELEGSGTEIYGPPKKVKSPYGNLNFSSKEVQEALQKWKSEGGHIDELGEVGPGMTPRLSEPSTSYESKPQLSPFHEKRSVAARDNKTLQKLQAASANPEAMKKQLDQMKPGSMIRMNEPGYSVYVKQADGSWMYRRYHQEPQKVTTDDITEGVKNLMNPKTGKPYSPQEALKAVASPKPGERGRDAYWDSIRAVADLEPNAGDNYTGKRVTFRQALKNGALRAKGLLQYPKEQGNASAEYTTENVEKREDGSMIIHSTGKATDLMPNGTGVTKIDNKDLMKPNPDDRVYNTLQEHCMMNERGELVLTPEREKLHQDAVEELFRDAIKPGPGEEKVCTFMGGGSAAGKGTIQKSGIANLPDAKHSPVIDPDEMKKRIPEYVDTAFSKDHKKAASMGHEESSAMGKRAMEAAIANGYNFTLDGTGDGNPDSQIKKIKTAQANGYKVKGCYVTCPTEMAVKRNAGRSETDEYNRLVPEKEVRRIHSKVSQVFEKVAKAMDECKLYDTSGGKPVLIAEFKNGKRTFVDQKRYDAFIAKEAEEKIMNQQLAKKKRKN